MTVAVNGFYGVPGMSYQVPYLAEVEGGGGGTEFLNLM